MFAVRNPCTLIRKPIREPTAWGKHTSQNAFAWARYLPSIIARAVCLTETEPGCKAMLTTITTPAVSQTLDNKITSLRHNQSRLLILLDAITLCNFYPQATNIFAPPPKSWFQSVLFVYSRKMALFNVNMFHLC